jgi:hypothetical protein
MSMVADMFSGGPKPKTEPIPTRDMAADSTDPDAERRRRLAKGYGPGSVMLSGPGGVVQEMTGTRSAGGG